MKEDRESKEREKGRKRSKVMHKEEGGKEGRREG